MRKINLLLLCLVLLLGFVYAGISRPPRPPSNPGGMPTYPGKCRPTNRFAGIGILNIEIDPASRYLGCAAYHNESYKIFTVGTFSPPVTVWNGNSSITQWGKRCWSQTQARLELPWPNPDPFAPAQMVAWALGTWGCHQWSSFDEQIGSQSAVTGRLWRTTVFTDLPDSWY